MTIKFKTRLVELREKHGLSRMDLVRQADMSYPTVVSWENDELLRVNAGTVWHLLKVFDCSMDDLFYFVDDADSTSDS